MIFICQEEDFLYFNQIGEVLSYERIKANVSTRELCEGICERSRYARIEKGERGCEKIEAEALLQRLGVASGRFLYLIDPKEEDWLEAREQLVHSINYQSWEKVVFWRRKYEALTAGKSSLHQQFLMLADAIMCWRSGGAAETELTEAERSKIIQSLQEAWSISQRSDVSEEPCPSRMSYTELFIRSLYFRLLEEQGECEQALHGYQELLVYVKRQVNERGQVLLYPQLAYRCLCLLPETKQQRKELLYKESIAVIRQQGGLYFLADLLNWRRTRQETDLIQEVAATKDANVTGQRIQVVSINELPSLLLWLCQQYDVRLPDWLWYLPFGIEEVYRISDMVRGRREAMGMLQQGLAYGICDVSTISHLENGNRAPKRETLVKLFERLYVPSGNMLLTAQTGNSAQHRLLDEIRKLTMFSRHEEVAPLLEELKKHMVENRFSKQYVEFEIAENKRARGKINNAEHQELLWNALYLTVPRNSTPEKLKTWIFTRTEAMILNCLSYSCEAVEKSKEHIAWLRVLKEHYEHQPFSIEHYKGGYELTLLNLGNLLGNQGAYEEAIEMEDIAIRLALKTGGGNSLRVLLYDRGWNMEQLWESGVYTKEQSRPYIKAALLLNQLYEMQELVQHIEEHWEKFYKKG